MFMKNMYCKNALLVTSAIVLCSAPTLSRGEVRPSRETTHAINILKETIKDLKCFFEKKEDTSPKIIAHLNGYKPSDPVGREVKRTLYKAIKIFLEKLATLKGYKFLLHMTMYETTILDANKQVRILFEQLIKTIQAMPATTADEIANKAFFLKEIDVLLKDLDSFAVKMQGMGLGDKASIAGLIKRGLKSSAASLKTECA